MISYKQGMKERVDLKLSSKVFDTSQGDIVTTASDPTRWDFSARPLRKMPSDIPRNVSPRQF